MVFEFLVMLFTKFDVMNSPSPIGISTTKAHLKAHKGPQVSSCDISATTTQHRQGLFIASALSVVSEFVFKSAHLLPL